MGSKSSKRKLNKDVEKQKLCKVGLSLGRNAVKVEGNFQMGYHSKTDKKYATVDAEKYETVDAVKPTILATIPEEDGEENG